MPRRTPRTPDPTRRPMGRPVTTTSEKTGVYLDSDLKRRLGIEALRRGQTISDLVAEAIRAYLRPAMSPEEREKMKAWFKERRAAKAKAPVPPPEPAPSLPGLDAPTGGQVQGDNLDKPQVVEQPHKG